MMAFTPMANTVCAALAKSSKKSAVGWPLACLALADVSEAVATADAAKARSSPSLGVITSHRLSNTRSASLLGTAGAGLNTVATPCAWALPKAATATAIGTSFEATTTRAPTMAECAASTCATSSPALAPALTAMLLSPLSYTSICATPLASPAARTTCAVSMPSSRQSAVAICPKASSPIRATSDTAAPMRAAATAAFEPLPPGETVKPCAATVSPTVSGRAMREVKSAFQLAIHTTLGLVTSTHTP